MAFRLEQVDPGGMGAQIASLPRQLEEGVVLAEGPASLPSRRGLRQVVVVGMGGSAIGGDLLASYLSPELRLPLLVERGPRLPAYVGADSLVVAISYSGETEETLTAFGEALRRGARSLAVASGGRLLRRARSGGVPALALPGGAAPRAALGHLFSSVLVALSRMGLLPSQRGPLEEAASVLRAGNAEFSPDASSKRNPTLALARRLAGRVPVVYGTHRGTDAVARRWRCQFHENAKSWAAEGV
ncbi:MAG: SIS domain-containing protein, partial [Nitrospinota bacterium]